MCISQAIRMKHLMTLAGILLISVSLSAQKTSSSKILFIPLDDRPPCLQFTQKMGEIGNAIVVAPPATLLGNFTTPGQAGKIIDWLKSQDLKSFDAAIISIDMLAYGGLVASRVHQIGFEEALTRVAVMQQIRNIAPKLPIYAQSVIMRLAPTGDGKNEAYRAKLADWAEVSVATDEKSKAHTVKLESEIPAAALANYKESRVRNLKLNLKALEDVKVGVIDYLILSQDDAKPKGIHIADRERLISQVKTYGVGERVLVMPGADEISMLLLARALNKKWNFAPKIKAVYSSTMLRDQPMPFEDRPLHKTVSFDIAAIGAQEVQDFAQADLLFYVYPSRFEKGRAESFATEIAHQVNQKKAVIVADIDPKGHVQGGDVDFTQALLTKNVLPKLYGYASWNTAGNTIGTTLPQGAIFALAKAKLLAQPLGRKKIQQAQDWFTFHRVLDDYYYHNLVRAQAKELMIKNKWDSFRLSDAQTKVVEEFCTGQLSQHFNTLNASYFSKTANRATNLSFLLPWNRTFEAAIDFNLNTTSKNK